MMKNSKHTEERKMADIRDSKNWGLKQNSYTLDRRKQIR